ncbi:hypothetical protein UFOVP1058_39 [uncultured Caudovirales phage]|uniref:Uncharacterized protein n=1 Tax=uncultured Caudovirales phage TaxID=2100421 RepID=A0A6J5P9L3_9CAUD|nr:hypothetical protein UFOVP656_41 [uncultured Caudovirales phage]CAB4167897.1 hypothetical protein UFOVP857_63 [uncultured Caudovirales phage]CAB4168486.1 hypothetical protein UFOVP879_52 [uncultured Caudovirales phage]CAB4181468.1 hypothetical protein UFOVP1058_39 [uncultured Caudovirales phage]CAB4196080.1 hypothetical protein UFOVP1289_63 [uncultured Caudovirales phage]
MNYATLVSTIQAYVENDFPDTAGSGGLTSTEQIDTFIQQAEQRIYNTVQLLNLRKNVVGSASSGNKYLTVPTDWLANFSLALIEPSTGAYSYLLNKDVNFIREAFPYPTVTGAPTHYAMFDNSSYILGPTPDASYQFELHYFYYPESIVTASTTWLGDNFDSVLLYGSLLEAYTFMKGEADVLSGYQSRYENVLAMLKAYGEGKNRQDMYRTPQVRYPVR